MRRPMIAERCGTTALCVVVSEDNLIIGNVGDSRAVSVSPYKADVCGLGLDEFRVGDVLGRASNSIDRRSQTREPEGDAEDPSSRCVDVHVWMSKHLRINTLWFLRRPDHKWQD